MTLYRYELFCENEPQDVGFLVGLEDLGLSAEKEAFYYAPFDGALAVPNMPRMYDSISFFTEEGRRRFHDAIQHLASAYQGSIFDVMACSLELPEGLDDDIIYRDADQVCISKKRYMEQLAATAKKQPYLPREGATPMEPELNVTEHKLLTKEDILNGIEQSDDLTIEEASDSCVVVWDDGDAKIIPFHFLEHMNSESLSDRIHISKDIPQKYQVDKSLLADYLWNVCDRNAFITLDQIVVIWSEPEDPETFDPPEFVDSESKRLYKEIGDEYALEIGSDLLGQLWFERNIVVVNMGEIVRASEDIAKENSDLYSPYFSLENQVLVGFLTTVIHELRHLQLDGNILLSEDDYPLYLGSEEEVEAYCREAFEGHSYSADLMPNLYKKEKRPLFEQIKSAAVKAADCQVPTKREKQDREQAI